MIQATVMFPASGILIVDEQRAVVFRLHYRTLKEASAKLDMTFNEVMDHDGGNWYVSFVHRELQDDESADLQLTISNALEQAADIPQHARKMAQRLGMAQLLTLLGDGEKNINPGD